MNFMLSKQLYLHAFVALLVCLAGNPASAQTPNPKEPVTVSDLDAILQEEILLKAKANRAKQRAELGRYASQAQTATATGGLPQLSWRRSTASGWLAKFILNDGASIIAGVGEPLPGGYTVARIDQDGVELAHDGERIELTAAAAGSPIKASPQPMSPGTAAPAFSPLPTAVSPQ